MCVRASGVDEDIEGSLDEDERPSGGMWKFEPDDDCCWWCLGWKPKGLDTDESFDE